MVGTEIDVCVSMLVHVLSFEGVYNFDICLSGNIKIGFKRHTSNIYTWSEYSHFCIMVLFMNI